jgi:hypothetical protein
MKSWQLKNVSQNKGYLRDVGYNEATRNNLKDSRGAFVPGPAGGGFSGLRLSTSVF